MDEKKKNVFVIHGRNEDARKAMFSFLRSIGLHPLEWTEIIQQNSEGSPYIGTLLTNVFSNVQAAVVLMTPDDVAMLRGPFQSKHDELWEKELTPQARPNVLFEAGMAMGKFPKRTVIVQLGRLRPFSDIVGRHVVRLDNSYSKRHELAIKLHSSGCAVNISGQDWQTEGDFELKNLQREIPKQTPTADDEPTKLAQNSGLSNSELDDVLSFGDNTVEILAPLKGSLGKRQKIGSICILSAFHMIFLEDWVGGGILSQSLRDSGIPDRGNNLPTILSSFNELFVRRGRGKSIEYKLTAPGRNLAFKILQNLGKGKDLDDLDL